MRATVGLILVVAAFLAACAGGGPAPTVTPIAFVASAPTTPPTTPTTAAAPTAPTTVVFQTEDGLTLDGRLFGEGETAVVLAHMRPRDQTSWSAFAELLADKGYLALTFDFRGYGESEGRKELGLLDRDVRAAVEFLRRRGAQKVVLIGASMGGTACLKVAGGDPDVAGVASISAPSAIAGLAVSSAEIAAIEGQKLFVASEDDARGTYVEVARRFFDIAREPKGLQTFSGKAHGTNLFLGEHGAEFQALLLDFVQQAAGLAD